MLREHISETGALASYPHAHWPAAACLYATGHEAIAELIVNHVGVTMVDALPASNLGWLLVTLLPVGLSAHAPVVHKAVERLSETQ